MSTRSGLSSSIAYGFTKRSLLPADVTVPKGKFCSLGNRGVSPVETQSIRSRTRFHKFRSSDVGTIEDTTNNCESVGMGNGYVSGLAEKQDALLRRKCPIHTVTSMLANYSSV